MTHSSLRPAAEHVRESVARLRESNSRLEAVAEAVSQFAEARARGELMSIIRTAARKVAQADGVSIALRQGESSYYADEDAISPLWKGQRFPLNECVSGWAMLNRQTAVVPDISADERVPFREYQSTFVRSLVMVPLDPDAAIGVYWAKPRVLGLDEVAALETLARAAGTALRNIELLGSLRISEERYRTLFDSIDEGFCVIEMIFDAQGKACDYRFVEVNPAFERQTGMRDALGKRMRELVPEHEAHWFEIYGRIALTGEPLRFENRAAGLHRWYDVYAFALGEAGTRNVAILFNDITHRKASEIRQQLLMRELDHRAKNMLATIQAVVSLSARSYSDVGEYTKAIQSRLRSLAEAHDLVADAHWNGANLRTLIEKELAPYVDGRPLAARINGDDVVLKPAAAMALTLSIHELATNAAKYGALSTKSGIVQLSWQLKADHSLELRWKEQGGPPVEPPKRRGFGSLLIERSLEGELGGRAKLRFEPGGLRCTICVPAEEIVSVSATCTGTR